MKGLSLRTKVFLLFAGTALLTVLPALVLITRAVEHRVYERAVEELLGARDALQTYWDVQDEVLLEKARRIALEPGLLAPLKSGDTVALRRTLRRRVEEGRIILVADSTGMPLVGPSVDSAALAEGVTRRSVTNLRDIEDNAILRMAMWPVWGDSGGVAGVVGVGRRLDAEAMRDLKRVTGANEVAIISGDSLLATTLADSLARVLRSTDLASVAERTGVWRLVDRIPYLYTAYRLTTAEGPSAVVLFRPVAEELRVARGIQRSLVWIGLVTVVLSLLLAGIVSRFVARPAQVLAAAATELAKGNYTAPLPRASGDEVGQLARSFGEMRAAIAERETRLRSAQAELIHREKLAAMGRLVAQLSHEINNPIYNIQNCLEALARRGDPHDPNREFLELAQEELHRMAELTRQLLDQSRPLSDAARSLDMNDMVRRVLTLARPELSSRGVRVELELDPELPDVVAHPAAIQQVLANLVDNAADAMPGGGVLRLVTTATDDVVEIVVEDTGGGISEEHLPHIFEAFYTTKPGVSGIGLGLFVSEGIIRGHRGRISVQSRAGEGCRFIVSLPRQTLDPALADPSASGDDLTGSEATLSQPTA